MKLPHLALIIFALTLPQLSFSQSLTNQQAQEIGKRIWYNECGGRIDGLIDWNEGEEFPSLGILHMIWYPKGYKGPFTESFPMFLNYVKNSNPSTIPYWLADQAGSPWKTRDDFLRAKTSTQYQQLQSFLVATIPQQTQFALFRLQAAIPEILSHSDSQEQSQMIQKRIDKLDKDMPGMYALIDYVNFKGEGTNPRERYNGQGWGLLQVLQNMNDRNPNALDAFSTSAINLLTLRVKNSPPERHEDRWLKGWISRIRTYLDSADPKSPNGF
jgi:hypothetical protein